MWQPGRGGRVARPRRTRYKRPVMRIGVFGGTFNPIHFGHLRSAEEVRHGQHLDRVLFIPSATPPHKTQRHLAAASDRLAMVRLAVRGNPGFQACDIEVRRGGPSYSVQTLEALHRRQPQAKLVFVIGLDAFRDIGTWFEYRRLFELADVVVTSRPPYFEGDPLACLPVAARQDFCYKRRGSDVVHVCGNRVAFQRISDLAISATQIRQLLRRGRSVTYLLPPAVERYIAARGLYQREA